MSSQNPLHNFRTYSYKHILIACDTTAVAEYISNLGSEQTFNEIITQKGAGSRSSNEEGSDADGIKVNKITGKGKYAIVINSFSDSEFYISSASWETLMAPPFSTKTPNKDFVTTVATEGTLHIVEPRGFRFLNVVANVGARLGCGPVAIIWVLKTIFVGQRDSTGLPDYISYIKPFLFSLLNVTASFDEGGSNYDIPVVASSNGMSKAPVMSRANVNSLSVGTNDTLQVAMAKLEQLLNNVYDAKIKELSAAGIIQTENTKKRRLKYVIILDDVYQQSDFTFDKFLTSQTGESNRTGGVITFGNNTDIEYMIRQVMIRCSKVVDASKEKPNKIFKIYSVFSSDNEFGYINYYIKQFSVPESVGPGGDIHADTVYEALEYDYIYTGNNVDIVDFQMRMEQGLAFFQYLQVIETATEDQRLHSKAVKSDVSRPLSEKENPDDNTSFIMPVAPNERLLSRSVKDPLSTQEFNTALSKYASIETLEAAMTIHGNPILLNDMNLMPSDYRPKAGNTNPNPNALLSNWQTAPSLCRVNVSMPSNNSLTGIGGPNMQFQEPFWYRGFFTILSINHKFENGIFTQQLNMINVRAGDDIVHPPEIEEKTQIDVRDKV